MVDKDEDRIGYTFNSIYESTSLLIITQIHILNSIQLGLVL